MTRKDYVAIARAVSDSFPISKDRTPVLVSARDALYNVARNLADELQRDNPRFDRSRFLKACGVQS